MKQLKHKLAIPRSLKFLPLLAALLLLPLISSAAGQKSNQEKLDSFLTRIQQASDQVTSLSSDFTQEKHLSLFAEPIIFTGKLALVRPDKLRWQFTAPIPSILLLSGDAGMRCNDDQKPEYFQLSKDPIMQEVSEQLWLWLGGDYSKLGSQYRLQLEGESTLLITPQDKTTAAFIESVTITFDEASLQPQKVQINEPGGDLTIITFNSTTINTELSEKLFTDCSTNE